MWCDQMQLNTCSHPGEGKSDAGNLKTKSTVCRNRVLGSSLARSGEWGTTFQFIPYTYLLGAWLGTAQPLGILADMPGWILPLRRSKFSSKHLINFNFLIRSFLLFEMKATWGSWETMLQPEL